MFRKLFGLGKKVEEKTATLGEMSEADLLGKCSLEERSFWLHRTSIKYYTGQELFERFYSTPLGCDVITPWATLRVYVNSYNEGVFGDIWLNKNTADRCPINLSSYFAEMIMRRLLEELTKEKELPYKRGEAFLSGRVVV